MVSPLPNGDCGRLSRILLTLAGGYGVLAVAFGAYRAHGFPRALKAAGLDPSEITERVSLLGLAVQYTLLHALAIVAVLALTHTRFRNLTASLFSAGILVFSGSLTLNATQGYRPPAFVPPVGGMLLILGWLSVMLIAWIPSRAKEGATC